VFISAGPSLILKLDGAEMITLTGPGSSKARTVIGTDMLAENALWPLSQAQLDRLAHAKKVEFRIVGDQQILTGEWKQHIFKDAAYFAAEAPKILHPEAPLVAMLVDAAKTQSRRSCAPTARAPSLGPPVRLGVNMVAVNKPLADFLHMPAPQGMFVAKVTPGSAAEAAGIKPGDILMRFGETDLMSQCDLFAALAATPSGSTIPITALRENSSWVANVKLQADATTQTAQAPPPGPPADAARLTDIYTALTKLDELRRKGILTDAEFEAQKQKILNSK